MRKLQLVQALHGRKGLLGFRGSLQELPLPTNRELRNAYPEMDIHLDPVDLAIDNMVFVFCGEPEGFPLDHDQS